MNEAATPQTASVGSDPTVHRDTPPADMASPIEVAASAGSEHASLKVITAQLAEDVRPLVDRLTAVPEHARPLIQRARPWADVFLPLVDEMRPLMDDLRPVAQDLRALSGELMSRGRSAAARVALIDLDPARSVVQTVGVGARRLASVRPAPRVSTPRPSAPAMRLPSIGPRLAALVRFLAAPLRHRRWMFRVVAVGLIASVLGNASLRDAMVAEINWTRSAVETIELPQVALPAFEIPAIELPKIEMPAVVLPAFELPTIDLSALQGAKQDPTPAKLVPAQFELPPLDAYRATFQSQAPYPTVAPNGTVEWVVALRNTGSVGWYRGIAGAQAALALPDGTEAAVQTTAYVAPGQVGWFVVRFRAPAGPGTHTVSLLPRIDGRGELPDLGIFTVVTVR